MESAWANATRAPPPLRPTRSPALKTLTTVVDWHHDQKHRTSPKQKYSEHSLFEMVRIHRSPGTLFYTVAATFTAEYPTGSILCYQTVERLD